MKPEDLTIDFEEGGILTTRQLDKVILSKCAWTTIIVRYLTWVKAEQEYSADKYIIRRYQKRDVKYTPRSKFNNNNDKQDTIIIAAREV